MKKESISKKRKKRTKKVYKTLADFLSDYEVMLGNARGPAVLPKLEACGYPLPVLEEKLAELEALRTLSYAQAAQEGEELAAAEKCRVAFTALNEDYIDHIKLARVAFRKDPGAKTALCLKGKRQRTRAGYISEGLIFYDNVLDTPAYVTAMAARGVSVADLTAKRDAMLQLRSLHHDQAAVAGEARKATKETQEARAALQGWLNDFVQTAKISLRKHGQLIEQLGIKVPS